MHWADVLAGELLEEGDRHVLATAITPSGPIHVGNMREVLTADAVYRSVRREGGEAELIYIGDTYDPLRKVYPFLEESAFAEHVGRPLSDIPSPSGSYGSYAEEFLTPFLEDLEELGIRPRVLLAHEMYRGGDYVDATKAAMDAAPAIREILESVSKRQLPRDWIPFNVQCEACGRLSHTKPLLYEYPYIEYECTHADHAPDGHEARKDVREPGGGKLPWRVDWPARWSFLGVTFEAFGKDHAAAGGSWDTGKEIARRVYDREPPHHTVYEFIQLKGQGAMHSSTGTAVSAREMLHMTPPEVLRFLLMRYQPGKHIDFDPGLGLVNLVDEYDRWEAAYHAGEDHPDMKELRRTYELSQPGEAPDHQPPQVGYKHLATVVQLEESFEGVVENLQRSGLLPEGASDADLAHVETRSEHARYWLDNFAPDQVKFELQRDGAPLDALGGLTDDQRDFATRLADALAEAPWNGEDIHNAVYSAKDAAGVKPGKAFQTIYLAFLGRPRGPRAGHFLASLERGFVVERLREAARGPGADGGAS